ncbi:nuclear transport factor 2 family protein [Chengkuizengella axinellae]|uniref:Nuclear transport factor 2 family protein n=1 Tax=Chengkuizengella axinellae TaxID=3064388 RepID=A0ABT9J1B1_9BACL|nr:nuclear transport factor 2 family protein [Chengkuizengella sp. 2205SS18-9]MDP5275382.1 nuclear transport factor 2 family protein [Chengkuizengella sp. 2205SS18-9]
MNANANEELIHKLYTSFQNKDFATIRSCYHEKATFNDPAFTNLKGKEPSAMWHMLFGNNDQVKVTFDNVKADNFKGQARWIAKYPFSQTGREVTNVIHASFEFQDGKIIRHVDEFDFYKWSKMAFGPIGFLIGWTSFFRRKLQSTVNEKLHKYIEKHPEYQK